jgi:hypothetical protein
MPLSKDTPLRFRSSGVEFTGRQRDPALRTTASEVSFPMIVHRLTVDGKDYFLPDPVSELRAKILEAVKAGGGYVNIPPLRTGPGVDILFSPGMPVTWTQIDVGGEPEPAEESPSMYRQFDGFDGL